MSERAAELAVKEKIIDIKLKILDIEQKLHSLTSFLIKLEKKLYGQNTQQEGTRSISLACKREDDSASRETVGRAIPKSSLFSKVVDGDRLSEE